MLSGVRHRVDIIQPGTLKGFTRSDFIRFSARIPLNNRGSYQCDFMTNDSSIATLDNGDLLQFWRNDPQDTIDWRKVFVGVHRSPIDTRTTSRCSVSSLPYLQDYSSNGFGLNDLIELAFVKWAAESSEAAKNTDAATAIYEYIFENIGPGALSASGRYVDNVIAALTVNVPALSGVNYEGDNAEKKLLSTCRQIAAFALAGGIPLIFETLQVGNSYTFEINIRQPTNRTAKGIDPNTGNNSAGNKPVILGLSMGNVQEITRIDDYSDEANQITALGKGVNADKRVRSRTAAGIINDINRRELIVNGTEQNTDQELDDLADSFISELKARPQFAVVLSDANVTIFRDFQPFDIVSLEWGGSYFDAWVNDVRIDVRRSGGSPVENVAIEVTILE